MRSKRFDLERLVPQVAMATQSSPNPSPKIYARWSTKPRTHLVMGVWLLTSGVTTSHSTPKLNSTAYRVWDVGSGEEVVQQAYQLSKI